MDIKGWPSAAGDQLFFHLFLEHLVQGWTAHPRLTSVLRLSHIWTRRNHGGVLTGYPYHVPTFHSWSLPSFEIVPAPPLPVAQTSVHDIFKSSRLCWMSFLALVRTCCGMFKEGYAFLLPRHGSNSWYKINANTSRVHLVIRRIQ